MFSNEYARLGAHHEDVILCLFKALGALARGALRGRAGDDDVRRHGHAVRDQRLVHGAAVLQEVLLEDVVDEKGLGGAHVRLRLGEREAQRLPHQQRIAFRPLLDGLVQNDLKASLSR